MSQFEFKLPDIGEGVTEGEIVSWLVNVGDSVQEDQEIVEVMTDKATVTIGAPKAGKVSKLGGNVGDVVPVGDVLIVLDTDGAGGNGQAAASPGAAAAQAPQDSGATAVGDIKEDLPGMAPAKPARSEERAPAPSSAGGYFNEKPLAAPATRKLARELGVDLRRVEPSGPAGRVTQEDVERSSRAGESKAVPEARPSEPAAPAERAPAPRIDITGQDQRLPIRGLRKRIYENMARAKHTAAHFTYVDECDVSQLKALRNRTKPHAEREGVKVTFLPFIIKAVVAALKKHPSLNCIVDDAKQELVLKGSYDIGIATATDAGLIVPVLRGADRRSILDIAGEVERLANEARAGKTRQEDVGGSSFTITSLGKLGGLFATPVVNYPEVAILGIHEIKKKPVIRGEEIAIGEVMLLSLSFDHRVIDGHVGAAFAQEIIGYLEDPDRLLVEMS